MPRYGRQIAIAVAKKASEESVAKKNAKACGYCGVGGHKAEDCYSKPCGYCKVAGHKEENCYTKKNDVARQEREAKRQEYEEKKNLARQEFFEFKEAFSAGYFCVFCYEEHHYSKCDCLHAIPDDIKRTLMFCASSIAHGIVASAIHGYFAGSDVYVTPQMFCDFSKAVTAVDIENSSLTYRQFVIHYKKFARKQLLKEPRVDDHRDTFVNRIKKCIESDVFEMFNHCNVVVNNVVLQHNKVKQYTHY